MKVLLYALLIADAISTAHGERQLGFHEQNAIARPFTHGGIVMVVAGEAVGQYAVDRATARWSPGERRVVDAFELYLEADAVSHNLRQP